MTATRFLTGWVLVLAAGGLGSGAAADLYMLSSHGKLNLGHDTNVREHIREARQVGDSFVRVEAGAQLRALTALTWRPSRISFRWATDEYGASREETRLLLDGRAQWLWRVGPQRVRLDWHGTLKHHPQASWRRVRRQEVLLDGTSGGRAKAQCQWMVSGFRAETADGGPADRWGWQVGTSLERPLSPHWKAAVLVGGGVTVLNEAALNDPTTGRDMLLDDDHEDRHIRFGVRLNRLITPRGTLTYRVRNVTSNSYGYDYLRHEFEAVLGFRLPHRVALLAVGRWQAPIYADRGYRVYSLREDSDDPDVGARTGVTLQLSRPLNEAMAAQVRGGWQRNESRISGRYYEKMTFTIGIKYTSVGK